MVLEAGEERKFHQDGDALVVRRSFGSGDSVVGFGEASGKVEASWVLF